ncbi:MAG TPA: hypothetical protein VE397_02230 [Stellaceae bacterium]|jgi:mannose-6-phosphate isomerase-like protein (cupin superfamily)|nr:hypothetical protein [Stellaceae bacterium]
MADTKTPDPRKPPVPAKPEAAKPRQSMVVDLGARYAQLLDGGSLVPVEAGTDFWARFAAQPALGQGWLVWTLAQARDWANWEMYPQGDALFYLLSGAVDFVLQEGDVERNHSLRPSNACLVPRGIWHRVIVQKPATLLCITRSVGRQLRPVEAKRA